MSVGRTDEEGVPGPLAGANGAALANRPCARPGYRFAPVSMHDGRFHAVRREYPYFGYVGAKVEGVAPVAMLSNDDDRVAQCYFFYGPDSFETMSLRVWRRLAESSRFVFDVGAFTGVYSLVAAGANPRARVRAVEPSARTFWRLTDNVRANGLQGRVRTHNFAAGAADGVSELNVFRGPRVLDAGASLRGKKGNVTRTELVETRRLDGLAAGEGVPRADLVKIDVERSELEVIEGTMGLLGHEPAILAEVFSVDELREIHGLLSPRGYSFAVIDDLGQKAHVGDFGAHEEGRNVLFRAGPPGELAAFLDSIVPL